MDFNEQSVKLLDRLTGKAAAAYNASEYGDMSQAHFAPSIADGKPVRYLITLPQADIYARLAIGAIEVAASDVGLKTQKAAADGPNTMSIGNSRKRHADTDLDIDRSIRIDAPVNKREEFLEALERVVSWIETHHDELREKFDLAKIGQVDINRDVRTEATGGRLPMRAATKVMLNIARGEDGQLEFRTGVLTSNPLLIESLKTKKGVKLAPFEMEWNIETHNTYGGVNAVPKNRIDSLTIEAAIGEAQQKHGEQKTIRDTFHSP